MKISIRDFRRVERVDLVANPICLVAGLNGEGKTSTFQAVQAGLLRSPLTLPGVLMKTASFLVHTGAKEGSVKIETDDGSVSVSYPKCVVEVDGDNAPMSSEVAAGRLSILDLPDKDRAAALVETMRCVPSFEELSGKMTDLGYSEKAIATVWKEIEEKGWDVAHSRAKEAGTKLKGGWEAATGEKWGDKRAETWLPKDWTDDLNGADIEELRMEVIDAQSALERDLQNGAVDASKVDELRLAVDAARGADVAGHKEKVEKLRTELQSLQDKRAALPPADGDRGIPCPSCGTHLVYEKANAAAMPTLKVAEEISEKDLKQRRMERAGLDGDIEKHTSDLRAAEAALRNAESLELRGHDAEVRLSDLEASGTGEDLLANARALVETANTRFRLAEQKAKATQAFTMWSRNSGLIDVLSPTGVRRTAMIRKLSELNERLAKICSDAKWGVVRIDDDLEAWMNTEPYWILSESVQFRCRVSLQIAIAQIDGSSAILIDRADMLDQKGRNGLFTMLKKSGLKAIVCMTTSARDKTPNLAAAGYGSTVWMDAGIGTAMETAA